MRPAAQRPGGDLDSGRLLIDAIVPKARGFMGLGTTTKLGLRQG